MDKLQESLEWEKIQNIFPLFLQTSTTKKSKSKKDINIYQNLQKQEIKDPKKLINNDSPIYQADDYQTIQEIQDIQKIQFSLNNKILAQNCQHLQKFETQRITNKKSIIYWLEKYKFLKKRFQNKVLHSTKFIQKLDEIFFNINTIYETILINQDVYTLQNINEYSILKKEFKDQYIKQNTFKNQMPFDKQREKEIILLKKTINQQNQVLIKTIQDKIQIEQKFNYHQIQIQKLTKQNEQLNNKINDLNNKLNDNNKQQYTSKQIKLILQKIIQLQQSLAEIKKKNQKETFFDHEQKSTQKVDKKNQFLKNHNFQQGKSLKKSTEAQYQLKKSYKNIRILKSSEDFKKTFKIIEIESIKAQNKELLKMNVDLQLQVNNLKKKLKKSYQKFLQLASQFQKRKNSTISQSLYLLDKKTLKKINN